MMSNSIHKQTVKLQFITLHSFSQDVVQKRSCCLPARENGVVMASCLKTRAPREFYSLNPHYQLVTMRAKVPPSSDAERETASTTRNGMAPALVALKI